MFVIDKFYIRGSVHRNSRLKKSNEMQQYADIYLLLNYSKCFGRPSRPSSGVHKTVVVASGTDWLLVVSLVYLPNYVHLCSHRPISSCYFCHVLFPSDTSYLCTNYQHV